MCNCSRVRVTSLGEYRIERNMKKIMVIGAGTMGMDITQVFAVHGYSVIVHDIKDEILEISTQKMKKSLARLVEKGRISEKEKNATERQVSYTTSLDAAVDVDLVVEAAVERLEVKRSIFSSLDEICKKETIFASNTSSISITAIASGIKRADRFIGMHFFNPATVMQLIEVVRGARTSDATCKNIEKLAIDIDKTAVVVNDSPGFVVNKILVPMINEAAELLYTGVSTAKSIDSAIKLGANHPLGPLELGDLIGLDIVVSVMDVLYKKTGDSKYRCSLLLRKMVRAGDLGRKSGKGFYTYMK